MFATRGGDSQWHHWSRGTLPNHSGFWNITKAYTITESSNTAGPCTIDGHRYKRNTSKICETKNRVRHETHAFTEREGIKWGPLWTSCRRYCTSVAWKWQEVGKGHYYSYLLKGKQLWYNYHTYENYSEAQWWNQPTERHLKIQTKIRH